MLEIGIYVLALHALNRPIHKIEILRMDALEDPLQSRLKAEWFAPVYSKRLLGPDDFASRKVDRETPSVAECLRCRQVRLSTAQCLFGGLALGNIDDDGGVQRIGRRSRRESRRIAFDPDVSTVPAAVSFLVISGIPAILANILINRFRRFNILRVGVLARVHLSQFALRIPDHFLIRIVGGYKANIFVDQNDADGRILKYGSPLRFA